MGCWFEFATNLSILFLTGQRIIEADISQGPPKVVKMDTQNGTANCLKTTMQQAAFYTFLLISFYLLSL